MSQHPVKRVFYEDTAATPGLDFLFSGKVGLEQSDFRRRFMGPNISQRLIAAPSSLAAASPSVPMAPSGSRETPVAAASIPRLVSSRDSTCPWPPPAQVTAGVAQEETRAALRPDASRALPAGAAAALGLGGGMEHLTISDEKLDRAALLKALKLV
jgi:hypothetical protein